MTDQTPEIIFIDGNEYSLNNEPTIPNSHPSIEILPSEGISTDCWRGYIGSWLVKDKQLYLAQITGCYRLRGTKPIRASWYTGILEINEIELSPFDLQAPIKQQVMTIVAGNVTHIEYINTAQSNYIYPGTKKLVRQLVGSLALESDIYYRSFSVQADELQLLKFKFEKKDVFEKLTGRTIVKIQTDVLPLELTPSSKFKDGKFLYCISLSMDIYLAMELATMFDIEPRK